jgi:hypothetical protein
MVGVWMAPVTAQVMMTLFDVAMFQPWPGTPGCDPPPAEPADANLQMIGSTLLFRRACDGRDGKCATAPARST